MCCVLCVCASVDLDLLEEGDELVACGSVMSVLSEEGTIVVQTYPAGSGARSLGEGSVLCLRDRTVLGKVGTGDRRMV